MLSILIPIYNYNVYPLVKELNRQCVACGIDFEILCQDDGSSINCVENNQINDLDHCRYLINKKNIGRASNINNLVGFSKFDYVLILEADAFPFKKNYIEFYIERIQQEAQAVFGGVIYDDLKPPKNAVLRWIYGHSRESKDLGYRIKNPNDIVFSWNLLIQKKLFLINPFDSSITTYGFEDLVFLKKLKENNVIIQQIDNPCIHQNEEQSSVFIEKSKIAVLNLIKLSHKNVLQASDSKLLSTFQILKKLHLTTLIIFIFKSFEKFIEKNLLSERPSLFLFDLYRLGYFCKHAQTNNGRI